jgi:drug/metabolite transporter (DMT)-like permease
MFESLDNYLGQAAGIGTSVLWTGTSLLFTAASRRLGPTVVNSVRIATAVVLLGVTHRLLAGVWIPQATAGQVLYLALSGIIGLAIGDQALFTAFVELGTRLAMLIMTTAPLMAALFGWFVLGEVMRPIAWLGILLTVGGVGWVVAERPRGMPSRRSARRGRGLVLAFVAAACQAGGLLLSKQGMGHGWLPPSQHLPPQTASFLRMFFAAWGMVPIVTLVHLRRRGRLAAGLEPARPTARRAGFLLTFGGAVVGPFLGVWMSLVATNELGLGVAQTLCSLSPVFVLPFVVTIQKEHVSLRAVIGALVAVGGSTLLFLHPR